MGWRAIRRGMIRDMVEYAWIAREDVRSGRSRPETLREYERHLRMLRSRPPAWWPDPGPGRPQR